MSKIYNKKKKEFTGGFIQGLAFVRMRFTECVMSTVILTLFTSHFITF